MRLGITSLTKLTLSINIDWFNSLQTWHSTGEVHFKTVPRYSEGIRYCWYQYQAIYCIKHTCRPIQKYQKHGTNVLLIYSMEVPWCILQSTFWYHQCTMVLPQYLFSGAPRHFHKYHSSPIPQSISENTMIYVHSSKLHGFTMIHVQKYMNHSTPKYFKEYYSNTMVHVQKNMNYHSTPKYFKEYYSNTMVHFQKNMDLP